MTNATPITPRTARRGLTAVATALSAAFLLTTPGATNAAADGEGGYPQTS